MDNILSFCFGFWCFLIFGGNEGRLTDALDGMGGVFCRKKARRIPLWIGVCLLSSSPYLFGWVSLGGLGECECIYTIL